MATQKIDEETIKAVNDKFKILSKGELVPKFPSFDYQLRYILDRMVEK